MGENDSVSSGEPEVVADGVSRSGEYCVAGGVIVLIDGVIMVAE